MAELKTSFRRIQVTGAQARAIELRRRGMSLDEIARDLNCSVSTAQRNIVKGLRNMVQAPAQELRTLEYERLQFCINKVWDKVKKGDIPSINVVIRISERISKLMGLDAPVQIQGQGLTLAQLVLSVHAAVPEGKRHRLIDANGKDIDSDGADADALDDDADAAPGEGEARASPHAQATPTPAEAAGGCAQGGPTPPTDGKS